MSHLKRVPFSVPPFRGGVALAPKGKGVAPAANDWVPFVNALALASFQEQGKRQLKSLHDNTVIRYMVQNFCTRDKLSSQVRFAVVSPLQTPSAKCHFNSCERCGNTCHIFIEQDLQNAAAVVRLGRRSIPDPSKPSPMDKIERTRMQRASCCFCYRVCTSMSRGMLWP